MKDLLRILSNKKILIAFLLTVGLALFLNGSIGITVDRAIWSRRPFLTGVVTGLLTLAFSFFILETWRQEHTNQLWHEVAKVAYKDISRACRDMVATVQLLYTCLDQLPSEYNSNILDPWDLKLHERARVSKRDSSVPILMQHDTVMIGNQDRHFSLSRCVQLCEDESWRQWSLAQIDLLWTKHCDLIAQWAPLMMQSDQSREFLNNFSMFDHNFRRIYFNLYEFQSGSGEKLWSELTLLDLRARAMYNSLRGAARPDQVNRPDLFKLCADQDLKLSRILRRIQMSEDLPNYCPNLISKT